MKFCTLFSGSSGNSIYISDGATSILIDAGVPGVRIENALKEIGEEPENIKGIFVTHEHSDHIQGIGILARRHGIPIYANEETVCFMKSQGCLKKISDENIRIIERGTAVIGDLAVSDFPISHDAVNPCGYVVTDGRKKISVATDTGIVTDTIRSAVLGSDAVILEANHDEHMLDAGPYPFVLKQRIKSEKGHLSNDEAAELAAELVRNGTKNIMLGHLSNQNNYPQLAYETVNAKLKIEKLSIERLSVAPRFEISDMQEV